MIEWIAERLNTTPTVVALSTARMTGALGNSLLIVLLPVYIAAMPPESLPMARELLVGIMISAFGAVMTVVQPVAAAVSDKLDRRKPFILAGLVIMFFGTMGYVVFDEVIPVIILRAIQGVGVAIIIVPSIAIITSSTGRHGRGTAVGVYDTMRMIGFSGGPLLGGALQVTFGFTTAFVVGASFSLLALYLVWRNVPEVAAADTAKAREKPDPNLQAEIDDRKVLFALLTLAAAQCVMAIGFASITTLENVFNERLEQTALGFGVAFAALTIARFLIQIPVGRLADRRGRRRLIIGGQVVFALLLLGVGQVTASWQLVMLTAGLGLATGCIAAPAFAVAGDLARAGSMGKQMSFLTIGFGVGLAVGPVLAGILVETVGFENTYLVVGTGSILVALLTLAFVPETLLIKAAPNEELAESVG